VLPVRACLHVRALDHLQVDEPGLDPCGPDAEEDCAYEEPRSEHRPPSEMPGSPGDRNAGCTTLFARVVFGCAAGLLFCHRSS
jgi:hypothetical protein